MSSLLEENRWVSSDRTATFPIDLSEVIDPMQDFLELINGILNVTLEILEFVEAFITSLLDPILALLQTIIKTLKALLADLDQLGIYFAGDFAICGKQQFDLLRGGYLGFQQRMVDRWLLPDSKKPDFKASGAIAIYLYGSTNFIEGIEPIVKVLKLILGLFNADKKVKLKELPSIGDVTVVVDDEESLLARPELTEKNIELSFAVHNAPRNSGISPNIGGFIVEMSSFENGLLMAYSENVLPIKNQAGTNKTKKTQGLYKSVKGNNKRWYSGTFPDEDGSGGLEKRQNYLLRNPMDVVRIKPSDVKDAGRHMFVRTFGFALDQKNHTITIPFSKLPTAYNILPDGTVEETDAQTIHIRVTAVSKSVAEAIIEEGDMGLNRDLYDFPLNIVREEGIKNRLRLLPFSDIKNAFVPAYSNPAKVAGLAPTNQLLLETMEAAITCAYLTEFLVVMPNDADAIRDYEDKANAFGNTFFKQEGLLQAIMGNFQKEYEKKDPETYRKWVFSRIKTLAREMAQKFPEGLLPLVADYAIIRNNNYLHIFEDDSLDKGIFVDYRHPYRGEDKDLIYNAAREDCRNTGTNLEKRIFAVVEGSRETNDPNDDGRTLPSDTYHILVYAPTAVDLDDFSDPQKRWVGFDWAALNLFYLAQTSGSGGENSYDVVKAAYEFLFLSNANKVDKTTTGDWGNIRLLENGIPPLEEFLVKTIKFFEDLEEGLEGFGEKIKKAIALIEDKILQIQEIIALIDKVLEALKKMEITFDIPVDMLVHVGSGNDDLLRQLLSSSDQPPDGQKAYSVGMVLVAGGIPTVLIELLGLLFTGGE